MFSPRPHLAIAAALAAAVLATACDRKPTVIDPNVKAPEAPATPVAMPPAITSSKSYRCGDNSLVDVVLFADNKSATIKTETAGQPVRLTSDEAGKPMVADGYSVTVVGEAVEVVVPGKKSQTCTA